MTDPEGGTTLDALFTANEIVALEAAFDCAIPEDDWPGGWAGGGRRLLVEHGDDFLAGSIGALRSAVLQLDSIASVAHGRTFADLDARSRAETFGAALTSDTHADAVGALLTIAHQAFYGGTREPAGWAMLGFTAVPEGVTGLDPEPLRGIALEELNEQYDVVIVGAGAGGGVVAAELSASGLEVLVLERARRHRDVELRGNHLQGKRQALYAPTAGPGSGSPRVLELDDGSTRVVAGDGDADDYGLNAMTAGGGTRLWQGMAWRFHDEDFAMASTYGAPDESTLVDWPFGYDELEPYYSRVEWELGVAGDALSAVGRSTRRSVGYPMPALPEDPDRIAYTAAAGRLGLHASPIPFAINSVPRDDRAACVRCAQCLGHACPVNAKNGAHNTFLPRAIATGRCSVLFSAQATRIEHNGRGGATGVRIVVETEQGPITRLVGADKVVVSAGAIESPRLVLASGLGNDWVGRNLHSHAFATAYSYDAPAINDWTGPGHSVASVDWVHRGREAWGGGVMFDMPPAYPLAKADHGRLLAPAPFGEAHKRWMRESGNALGATSMVQEIPHARSRVSLDPVITDRYGMPVARVRGVAHAASRKAAEYMADRCTEWIAEVGARHIERLVNPGGGHGGEHAAGTMRLGHDPVGSACDARGLLHGTHNVYVADASVHPTNGGFNPTLTAMASAMRIAALMRSGA